MHKNDFFPFIFFSYHSFSLSYLELQIIFPCRDIGPATATLDNFFGLAENVQSFRLNLLVYIFYSFFCFFLIFIYLLIDLFLSDHAIILIYSKDAFYLFLLYNKEAFLTRCVSTIYIL